MKHAHWLATYVRLVITCVIATALPGGCAGSETGNPSATLRLGLRASDPAIASVGETGEAIRVHELWLSIESISGVPCAAGAEEVAITRESLQADLAQGLLHVGELPIGQYCGLHLTLAPAELSDLPMGTTSGPATVAVYGARADAVRFAVVSAALRDLVIPGAAFSVEKDHSLLLAFDVSAWLRDAVLDGATLTDGVALLDGREHPAATSSFEAQLTATLHDDLNANGHVDADEAALATLH